MIRVEQVSKTYGSVPVLRQLCLTIPPGGKTAILGRSGSGKTTLLRLIAGLDRLDGGEIYLGDRRVSCPQHYLPPHQRGIGFVFQSPALWPHLTVQQNITFGLAHLSKTEQKQRLELLLEKLAIAPLIDRYPHQLSGGEAKRVAFARTLAPRPPFLLLDEPLSNLDQGLKEELLTYLQDYLNVTQACTLYVTHDLAEAQFLTSDIQLLQDGQLVPHSGL